jgi:hypothetical protein
MTINKPDGEMSTIQLVNNYQNLQKNNRVKQTPSDHLQNVVNLRCLLSLRSKYRLIAFEA